MTKKLLLITLFLISVKLLAQSPVLSNFRVDDSQKNRIYFDSSEPITGSSATGFYLSDNQRKTITGVNISTSQLTGHYFIASANFDFWDTYAVRYEGGSNIQSSDGKALIKFWLTEVVNEISEPAPSGVAYFIRTTGNDSNDGLSHDSAFRTIKKALSLKGRTIYAEAGDYGYEYLNFSYSGTAANPIFLIGYKTTTNGVPDPITSNYWNRATNGNTVDASEMPTISGTTAVRNNTNTGTTSNRGISTKTGLIVKNFNIRTFFLGVYTTSSYLKLENINIADCSPRSGSVAWGGIYDPSSGGTNKPRILKNINVVDTRAIHVALKGDGSRFDNVNSYADLTSVSPDYFISIRNGSNNIIKNSLVWRDGSRKGSAHGIGLRSNLSVSDCAYNLFEDNVARGVVSAIELRHQGVRDNVVRNMVVYADATDVVGTGEQRRNGVVFRDNCHDNKLENIEIYGIEKAIYYSDHTGEEGSQAPAYNMIMRNILIYDVDHVFAFKGTSSFGLTYGNYFYNFTIDKANRFIVGSGANTFDSNSKFINLSISNVSRISGSPTPIYQNSNSYQNGFAINGTNISGHNPMFVGGGDYHLNEISKLIDLGSDIADNKYDFDGNPRPQGESYDIGAFEFKNDFIVSAGPDTDICNGDSVTLTASGGTSYEWSTGETTATINVSPTSTTTYTVTGSDADNSDTDDVIVTVIESSSVDAGPDVRICFSDESAILTATGVGDFLWSTGETTASITVSPTSTTTYTVTASNSCATDATDEVIVNVTPEIELTVSPDVTICTVGETVELSATGNGDFLWSTGETTPSISVSPTSTTTYTVTVTQDDCSDSDEITVTVSESPSVDAGPDVTICTLGETVELTATGVGDFLWSTGETTASITVSPTNTTTYSVTASNSCGVDATDEVIVNVPPEIDLTVSSNVTICTVGETVELTATGNGDFLWSTGETTPVINVSPTSTTTYTVTVTQGDCSDSGEIIVTVSELPSVDAGPDVSICTVGETVELTATGVGDFLWSTGETTASITVSPASTTTYTVTASNSCALDATDEVIVNIAPEIGLTVSSDVTICTVGETVELIATGNGDFLWSTGETTPVINVSPTSTTTYTVTVTQGDCSDSGEIIVTVSESPSVDAGPDVTICTDESVTLTATGVGDFLWSTGETTASIVVSPSGTFTYTVTASNSCAVDATDEVIVNVTPEIELTVSSDVTICSAGETVELSATGNGDFLWSTGETTPSISVSPTSTTTYTVTVTQGNCSDDSGEITVTVSEPPSVDAGPDVTICLDESVTLTATGVGDFLWSTGETTPSITVNPTSTTTYTATASNSCNPTIISDEIVVNVNPEVVLDAGEDKIICSGESITLIAVGNGEDFLWSTGETTTSITVSPSVTTEYTVTTTIGICSKVDQVIVTVNELPTVYAGPDVTLCSSNEIVILTATGVGDFLWSTGETTQSITVSPTSTTTYNVTASNGCNESASDDVIVVINDVPDVNAGSDITIVSGTTTELTATGQGSFLWSTGETTASISVNPTNTTIYIVTLTSPGGCSSTDNIEVTVQVSNIEVNADAGPDRNICIDSADTILTANGGDSYIWSTGEITKSISVKPTVTTVYTVEVFKESVSASDDVTVFIDEKCNNVLDLEVVVYPNPTNGLLHINVPDFSEKMNISIFNLNGQIVYTKSFDKTSSGKLKHQINLSRFGNGVYIVRFSNRYQSSSKKVLVI